MLKKREEAILVGVNLGNNKEEFNYSMEELRNLAAACNLESIGLVTQNLNKVNISYYIGKGKLEEMKILLEGKEESIVIFNDELSPSQVRNLEEELSCRVIDRTNLILAIFAQRAKTGEAKLQVEIARLQYMLPRLIGQGNLMARQRGGAGVIMRGVGETKLELDRRKIEAKISELNKELESLVQQRKLQRKQRKKSNIPVVSLVGYTNTGKSTLLNSMLEFYNHSVDKKVFEKDMLFATLGTSVRNIKLPDNKKFLLTDTVGFVSKLPHHLVKAFRSTLEEVTESHLLIHVVDYSNPNYKELIEVTNRTLKDIGIKNIPMIYAYNKSDLTDTSIPKIEENTIYMSAKKQIGLNQLVELMGEEIFNNYVKCQMLIPYDKGGVLAYFNENTNVLSSIYEETGTKLTLECRLDEIRKFQEYVVS